MSSDEQFVFDGIQQQPGVIPRWWKNVFVACLVFSPFYWVVYNTGAPGRSMAESYDQALAANTIKKFATIGELKPDEATILQFTQKENWLKVGKVVFKSNCASCHGRNGEGLVGPNLTDENFKNIRTVEDIGTVILKGANNNAMPAWEGKLHPNEIVLLAAFVASIRGTNVDGGKAAEGAEIAPWPPVPEEVAE